MTLTGIRDLIVLYPEMTVRQLAALLTMLEWPDLKSRELAANLKIHRSALTRIWDTLTTWGLMHRKKSEDDGRDVFGVLTDKGVELCKQLEAN
jgi:DNA-binding MarR family transcriptional regulator